MVSRVAIGLLLGSALVPALLVAGCDRQSPPAAQANASADEVAPDEVAPSAGAANDTGPTAPTGKVDRSHHGEAAPAIAFLDPAGKKTSLAAYRGKPVLLNLWATWCAPCIRELPSLDAAAAANVGRLTVLAVSQDMDRTKAAPFLLERRIARLAAFADPDMALSLHYRVNLPTTILFDAQGREVWRVAGAFDWDGAEAKKLLAEA